MRSGHKNTGRGNDWRGGNRNHRNFNNNNRSYQQQQTTNEANKESKWNNLLCDILNFSVGMRASPGTVQKWMIKFSVILGLECSKSGISSILKDDGTIGDYPKYEEPEFPVREEDDDNYDYDFQKVVFTTKYKTYNDKLEYLIIDKRLTVKLIIRYLGPDSLNRIRETENGVKAINEDDPKLLLETIYATHCTDILQEDTMNAVKAEQAFITIKQGENEPVLAYRQRFEALKQAVKSTLVKNNENPDHRMPSEASQVVIFIDGLHNGYREFKDSFNDGESGSCEYPKTMEDAFKRVKQATSKALSNITYRTYRGAFIAGRDNNNSRGGRSDNNRGRHNSRGNNGYFNNNNNSNNYKSNHNYSNGYQTKGYYNNYQGRSYYNNNNYNNNNDNNNSYYSKGSCSICHKNDHFAGNCPDRDDAVIDTALKSNTEMNAGKGSFKMKKN
jgi:hypothetical protein